MLVTVFLRLRLRDRTDNMYIQYNTIQKWFL